jgi:hypothetical protein
MYNNNFTILTRNASRNQVWTIIIAENAFARAPVWSSQPCSPG